MKQRSYEPVNILSMHLNYPDIVLAESSQVFAFVCFLTSCLRGYYLLITVFNNH
jgi:hypothetical protein